MQHSFLRTLTAVAVASAGILAFTAAASETASSAAATAGTPTAPAPCSSAAHRQFDFWSGQWDVADAAGKPAGRNEVTIEQQGCVLVERWTSVAGNTGLSINYYDPLAGTWTQQWVSPGLLLTMTGAVRDGAMVLEGPLQYTATGKVTRLRGTWTPLPDGRVRQHFQESSDDGKSWQDWFDGYYRRAGAPQQR